MNNNLKTFFLIILATFSLTSQAANLQMKWSSAGQKNGEFGHCIAINEPAEPEETTWDDNFLCFNKANHGFKYSYGGKIKNMNCAKLDIKGGSWRDNYICSKHHQVEFFQRHLPGGYQCIRIVELSDPDPRANGTKGNSNHLCIKK